MIQKYPIFDLDRITYTEELGDISLSGLMRVVTFGVPVVT